jgi:WW domain
MAKSAANASWKQARPWMVHTVRDARRVADERRSLDSRVEHLMSLEGGKFGERQARSSLHQANGDVRQAELILRIAGGGIVDSDDDSASKETTDATNENRKPKDASEPFFPEENCKAAREHEEVPFDCEAPRERQPERGVDDGHGNAGPIQEVSSSQDSPPPPISPEPLANSSRHAGLKTHKAEPVTAPSRDSTVREPRIAQSSSFSPAGRWEVRQDPRSGRTYYIDHVNKKSHWTLPVVPTAGDLQQESASKSDRDTLAPKVATPPSPPQLGSATRRTTIRTYKSERTMAAVPPLVRRASSSKALAVTERANPLSPTPQPLHVSTPAALPNGWESRQDPSSGRTYYVDHINKRSQWAPPVSTTASDLQIANSGKFDQQDAQSPQGTATRSKSPRPLVNTASGAVTTSRKNDRGLATDAPSIRRNSSSKKFTATEPQPMPSSIPAQALPSSSAPSLPKGWTSRIDPTSGRTYYVDHINKISQWALPKGAKESDIKLEEAHNVPDNCSDNEAAQPQSKSRRELLLTVRGRTNKSERMMRSAPLLAQRDAGRSHKSERILTSAPLPPNRDSSSESLKAIELLSAAGEALASSAALSLPEGWASRLDPSSGRMYYVDHINKRSQWTRPEAATADDELKEAHNAGQKMARSPLESSEAAPSVPRLPMSNATLGSVTKLHKSERIVAVSPLVRQDSSFKALSAIEERSEVSSTIQQASQTSLAPPLPRGWKSRVDPASGRMYYIDHINKKTQWTPPETSPASDQHSGDAQNGDQQNKSLSREHCDSEAAPSDAKASRLLDSARDPCIRTQSVLTADFPLVHRDSSSRVLTTTKPQMKASVEASQGSLPLATPSLPHGWTSRQDPESGRTYYIDHLSKRSQWELPETPTPRDHHRGGVRDVDHQHASSPAELCSDEEAPRPFQSPPRPLLNTSSGVVLGTHKSERTLAASSPSIRRHSFQTAASVREAQTALASPTLQNLPLAPTNQATLTLPHQWADAPWSIVIRSSETESIPAASPAAMRGPSTAPGKLLAAQSSAVLGADPSLPIDSSPPRIRRNIVYTRVTTEYIPPPGSGPSDIAPEQSRPGRSPVSRSPLEDPDSVPDLQVDSSVEASSANELDDAQFASTARESMSDRMERRVPPGRRARGAVFATMFASRRRRPLLLHRLFSLQRSRPGL